MRKKTWLTQNSEDLTKVFEELPPTPPLFPLILVEEPTYEGIVKYLAEGQPSIGLFSDEGARFLGGYAMNADNLLKTIAGISSLWDGKPITLDQEAKKTWITFHNKIDKAIAVGQPLHPIRRFASKAAEHVLRVVGGMALIEDPEIETISQPQVQRAIQLIEYYLEEWLRIQGYLGVSSDLLDAAAFLSWCQERDKTIISLQECYQRGPQFIRTAERARKIMKVLEDHGWAISTVDVHLPPSARGEKELKTHCLRNQGR